jgi:TonB family protein
MTTSNLIKSDLSISNFEKFEAEQTRLLLRSSGLTLVILFISLIIGFYVSQRRFKVAATPVAEAPVLEAELLPPDAPPPELHEARPRARQAITHEVTVSKVLNKGKEASTEMKKVLESDNQTVATSPLEASSHGPVVESAPTPKLPSYLKEQNLKTSILIEFLIAANGQAKANLLGTSGNEELDALALKTAQSWKFRPAKKDGKAIDSKVRLRINFEVN